MNRPNIILLTIDALRADHVSSNGYDRPTTPRMDELLAHAICPDVNYALSPSTIGSFPSLLTSSRPLSFGGFDRGGRGRPKSLAAGLSELGYATKHITSVHWVNRAFGYDAEYEEACFAPDALARAFQIFLAPDFAEFTNGTIRVTELEARSRDVINTFFSYTVPSCLQRSTISRSQRLDVRDYRWKVVAQILSDLERAWLTHPEDFLVDSAASLQQKKGWLPGVYWPRLRNFREIVEEVPFRILAETLGPHFPRLGRRLRWRKKQTPDAAQIVDRIIATLERDTGERPIYILSLIHI